MVNQQDAREQTDAVASTGSCYYKRIPIIKCIVLPLYNWVYAFTQMQIIHKTQRCYVLYICHLIYMHLFGLMGDLKHSEKYRSSISTVVMKQAKRTRLYRM